MVWEEGTTPREVGGQRFSRIGVVQLGAVGVSSHTGDQSAPDLAIAGDGSFVVVWQSLGQDGDREGIFAQRFGANGVEVAGGLQINTSTVGPQADPSIAMNESGEFFVAWSTVGGVSGQRFHSDGTRIGSEVRLNTTSGGVRPSAAMASDGTVMVAWQYSSGIYGRVLPGELAPLDVDDDGVTAAFTDGLLVLRFLYLFRGAALTDGAVGVRCGRCEDAAIEAYLEELLPSLDVDDDGTRQALTDGLLVLRYLLGFRGAELTSGAVAGNCRRCGPEEVIEYLAPLS